MSGFNRQAHWQQVYTEKGENQVSWFQERPTVSLELIEAVGVKPSSAIIDIGGGASRLVDALLDDGFEAVTVLDVSEAALEAARARLGERAAKVHWVNADVTAWRPTAQFDVWHDRAVFHFLTGSEERLAYVRQVAHAVRPGGHVIVSTFGPEGPTKCSGLDVARYDAEALHEQLGIRFRLVDSSKELHQTPFGTTQQFLYCYCRVE